MLVTKPRSASMYASRRFTRSFEGWIYGGAPPQEEYDSRAFGSTVEWTDTRDTQNSPSWRHRIAQGLNATGTLFGTSQEVEASPGHFYHRYVDGEGSPFQFTETTVLDGFLLSADFPTVALGTASKADNQALMAYLAKARSAQTTLQGGVVLGELGQTLRGITRRSELIYQGLNSYLLALRKRKWPKSRTKRREALADYWLEWSFGWKPLVSDIDDAMNLLATDRSFLSEDVFIRTRGEELFAQDTGAPSTTYMSWSTRQKTLYQVQYYGKVLRAVPNAIFGHGVTPSGFDSSNWLPTIWELIPYSFLVDYFSNIQEVVSSWAFNRVTISWLSKTVRVHNWNETYMGRPSSSFSSADAYPGYTACIVRSVNRQALSSFPQVTLEFEIPGLGFKWLNMAALAVSSRRSSYSLQ